jgi:SP family galactose:H+ symporter-like MFS transporter
VSTAFLPLVEAIGTGEVFLVFAVVCAFALWFVNRYVPETKERNFSEIDADLAGGLGWSEPRSELRIDVAQPVRATSRFRN